MEDLRAKQPRVGLLAVRCENSPYVSYSGNCKNSYLLSGSEYDENCYYGFWLYNSKDSTDCDYCKKCELCYDCVDCIECYNTNHSQDCTSCIDCEYCYSCGGCQNCFGCFGLRKNQYYIFNKPYTKENYSKEVEKIKSERSREAIFNHMMKLKKKVPVLCVHELSNVNSTGDYIYNCKNTEHCFDVKDLEDCMYCNNSERLKDCMDMSNSYYNSELDYEVMSEMDLINCDFCVTCFYSSNLDHCELVYNSHDCFGCFTLNHAEYCIFNKKYSKEEYFKEVEKIKAEMLKTGEYMQYLPSTYPYEDSNAAMHWSKP